MKCVLFILTLFLTAININAQQDTVTTESGLKYIVISQGSGEKAENGKAVEVHYTGALLDGKVFDSSRGRGEPLEFVLGAGQVIKGWDEGISLMKVGDQYKLIIPPVLGYGEKGMGGVIPGNATLVFDVELISVSEPKLPIADVLLEDIIFKGIDTAIAHYRELKNTEPDKYNFKESQLNILGYQLLQGGRNDDAVAILKLNCEMYPNSFNVYDSYGEACMYTGKNDLAIQNFKKSIELNPANDNAKEQLKKLGVQ